MRFHNKFLAVLCALPALAAPAAAQQILCPPPPGRIVMDSGTFSSQPGVTFRLRHFTATLIPQGETAPLCYAKTTIVSRAEIFVDNDSLTNVFTAKLNQGKSKIKDFKVENGLGTVKLSGKIVKVIPLDFSIAGTISTNGEAIILHAEKIKADGIPIKLLLEMIGQHLSSVLGLKDVNGVTVQGNDISFLPERIAHLKGHITSVESVEQGLMLRYGPKPKASLAPRAH